MVNINFNRLQNISKALEAYYADHKTYPLPDVGQDRQALVPHILTTPVAYLDKLPWDYFKKGKGFFEYGVNAAKGWIIIGYGPDGKNNHSKIIRGSELIGTITWSEDSLEFSRISSPFTYDPTNGTISPGYIWIRKGIQGIQESYYYND